MNKGVYSELHFISVLLKMVFLFRNHHYHQQEHQQQHQHQHHTHTHSTGAGRKRQGTTRMAQEAVKGPDFSVIK